MNTSQATAADTVTAPMQRVSGLFIAAYVLAQFGIWVALLTPMVLTIALRVGDLVEPAQKGTALGVILAIGAIVSVIVTPVAGNLSDAVTTRFGRRKPWIVFGAMAGACGLIVAGTAENLVVLALGWVLCQAGFNAAQAAMMAVLPDVVPYEQQGRVSGFLGVTTTAGTLAGTWISQFTQSSSLLLMLAPFALTAIFCGAFVTLLREKAQSARAKEPRTKIDIAGFTEPFRDRDFNFAFLSRFLIMLAWSFLLTYQLFYLTDHIGLDRAAATAVMVKSAGLIAMATVATSLLGGWISDLIGRRKPLVFLSAAIEASGFVLIAMSQSVDGFLFGVTIAAMGKGFYFGVDLALVAAVLPNPERTARDLGLFQIANTLPQSVAPAIAPIILTLGTGGVGGNYAALYAFAAASSLLGAFAIIPLRRVR
ncbi:MAG: MFS transporter [Pseudomonadota bacterium]